MWWMILSWLAYGIWAVAERKISGASVAWVYVMSAVVFLPLDFFLLWRAWGTPMPTRGELGWLVVACAFGFAGSASYMMANRAMPASAVAAFVATYPLVSIALFWLGGESLTVSQKVGILLTLVGGVLLTR